MYELQIFNENRGLAGSTKSSGSVELPGTAVREPLDWTI